MKVKEPKEGIFMILFDSYIEGNPELVTKMDDELNDGFEKTASYINAGTMDEAKLGEFQYLAQSAGFFAGISAAIKMIRELE